LEWDLHATGTLALYGRTEVVRKEIFGLGLHPKGFNHRHFYSDIDALTVGIIRDVDFDRWGRFGLGADVTAYRTSPELAEYYATSSISRSSTSTAARWFASTTSSSNRRRSTAISC